MARFRSSTSQARHSLRSRTAHGIARHENDDGKIHSVGTERNYRQALSGLARFLELEKRGDLSCLTRDNALRYLDVRSEIVGQKTLDLDRQAIQQLLGETLPRISSEHAEILKSRAYTDVQVDIIAARQTELHRFCTKLVADGGLRAHELLTILPVNERAADDHRTYRRDRFAGREHFRLFTVIGKGGLVREIAISLPLAAALDTQRLPEPRFVFDREIRYTQHYNLPGGKNWSDSFSKASTRALTWSTGGHGLRHKFAQDRMEILQSLGFRYMDALEIVSQELGHFRPDITKVYLR